MNDKQKRIYVQLTKMLKQKFVTEINYVDLIAVIDKLRSDILDNQKRKELDLESY